MAQFENLNDYVGVNQKMNIEQMEEVSRIIFSEYPYLKVTEIHLFFHRLKAGKYGEFFGSVDPIRIMESLQRFMKQRQSEIRYYEQRKEADILSKNKLEWAKNAVTREEYEQIKNNRK